LPNYSRFWINCIGYIISICFGSSSKRGNPQGCVNEVKDERRREKLGVVFNDKAFKMGFEKVDPSDASKGAKK
jgi:hypothetical protein